MYKPLLHQLFVHSVDETLPHQQPDGNLAEANANFLSILPWAICYSVPFENNPHYRSPKLLEGIVRLGEYNCGRVDDRGNYDAGWDEWRTLTWMEAMMRVEGDLDAGLVKKWTAKFVGAAREPLELIPDLDNFDGLIPNHPTWGYALLYRIGKLFDEPHYMDVAARAIRCVLRAQTPDGLFREGGSYAGFPGTAVTLYNLTSASAIDYYYRQSGDELAAAGLEKAWRWFYDFLLPDFSSVPNFDIRSRGWLPASHAMHVYPAEWFHRPEGAAIAEKALRDFLVLPDRKTPPRRREVGFISMQYNAIPDATKPVPPQWPEHHRMIASEAGIRRKNGWTAALTGMNNRFLSNVAPASFFGHERQDCVCVFHEKTGLILGSSHSRMQTELSTFVVYENGNAKYVADDAFLRVTDVIDTLLLMYGSNAAAVSIDTHHAEHCDVTFSLNGERGTRTRRGNGHAMSAMGARAHATVHLQGDETITLGDKSWSASRPQHEPLCINVPAKAVLDFGRFKLVSPESAFEFRWPVVTIDPYTLMMSAGRKMGVVEFVLYQPQNATATLRVVV